MANFEIGDPMEVNVPGLADNVKITIDESDRTEFWNFVKDIYKMKVKERPYCENDIPKYLSLSIITAMEFHNACSGAFHKPQPVRSQGNYHQPQEGAADSGGSLIDDDSESSPCDISG